MSNSDWWSRKLGGTPQPQQQPYQRPYQQPYAPPPQRPPYQQQAPVPQEDPSVPKTFIDALNTWGNKGGQALRSEGRNTCPNCGSANVFGMSNTGAVHNINSGMPARSSARCFECGWRENGVVQGEQSNWA